MPILLLDECMSPRVVVLLRELGVDAIHIRERGLEGSPDYVIWQYAIEQDRAIFTINGRDFYKLAGKSDTHPGVVVVPNGHNAATQLDLVKAALNWASTRNVETGFLN